MKKLNCGIGDEVVVIEGGSLRYGVVKNVFEELTPPIYVVEFEEGIEKVPHTRVAPAPKAETPKEQKHEPVEKSEITITPSEFMSITTNVIFEETKDNKLLGLEFAMLMDRIHRALFMDDWE